MTPVKSRRPCARRWPGQVQLISTLQPTLSGANMLPGPPHPRPPPHTLQTGFLKGRSLLTHDHASQKKEP